MKILGWGCFPLVFQWQIILLQDDSKNALNTFRYLRLNWNQINMKIITFPSSSSWIKPHLEKKYTIHLIKTSLFVETPKLVEFHISQFSSPCIKWQLLSCSKWWLTVRLQVINRTWAEGGLRENVHTQPRNSQALACVMLAAPVCILKAKTFFFRKNFPLTFLHMYLGNCFNNMTNYIWQ